MQTVWPNNLRYRALKSNYGVPKTGHPLFIPAPVLIPPYASGEARLYGLVRFRGHPP